MVASVFFACTRGTVFERSRCGRPLACFVGWVVEGARVPSLAPPLLCVAPLSLFCTSARKMPFSIEREMAALSPSAARRARTTLDGLHAKLVSAGLSPRDDSRLSYMFATGQISDEIDTVVHELVVVDAIHRHTAYGEVIEEVMREVASRCHQKYRLSWSDTWDMVRFYVPSMLKLHCVAQTGMQFPERGGGQVGDGAVVEGDAGARAAVAAMDVEVAGELTADTARRPVPPQ